MITAPVPRYSLSGAGDWTNVGPSPRSDLIPSVLVDQAQRDPSRRLRERGTVPMISFLRLSNVEGESRGPGVCASAVTTKEEF